MLATFTLRSADDWRRLVKVVRQHGPELAAKGTPLQVHLALKKARRRDVLNRFMWADVLAQISEQAVAGGKRYSAESWHEEMKRRHLPDTCAKGVEKWRINADGSRDLAMSTGDLDDDEFTDYLLAVQADAADRYRVTFYSYEDESA